MFYKGCYRVAQFENADAYPEHPGCGSAILEFLQRWDRDKFCRNLLRTRLVEKEEDLQDIAVGGLQDAATLDFILNADEDGPEIVLRSSMWFAAHSLSCEWAYVIDLDKNAFEVYTGFNFFPVPHSQRFAEVPVEFLYKQRYLGQKQFFQVRFLRKWSLRRLPLPHIFETTCLRLKEKHRREQRIRMKKEGRDVENSL